ncbi:MAG: 2OG-Fe(II) oxygenase [Sphingomonas bacterium]
MSSPPLSSSTAEETIRRPSRLASVTSPVVVSAQHTDIIGDPSEITESFARHRAVALSGLLDPAFLQTLIRLCGKASFVRDTETDVAQREREVPGIAGGALTLALKRQTLFEWLNQVTGCCPLHGTFGRVMQIQPQDPPSLNWHDDLPEDPSRRLAITINLSEHSYDGGLFELRAKQSGELLARHRHTELGSALIFEVSDQLEHRVWPVTAGGPRRTYTGWFLDGTGRP